MKKLIWVLIALLVIAGVIYFSLSGDNGATIVASTIPQPPAFP
ncbi:MAG: hypothetical protein Q8P57_02830 [Candidatus Pacearchaeota archaeon]|nr:hypothetical protein [Candidatus Pacearchaeota archaeon]